MNEKEKLSREAALITIKRIESFDELWAKNQKEGHQKFVKATRRIWEKNFATHKVLRNGEYINFPDFDAKITFGLFRLAGFKFDERKDVVYVMPGEEAKDRINLDTGNKSGLKVAKDWKNLTDTFDHHTEAAPLDTSTAKIVYQTLTELGLLEKNEALDRLVEFTTQMDNKNYPDQEKYFFQSWRTVLGLHHYISFKKLYEYFKSGRKPHEFLSEEEIKELGISPSVSQERKKLIEQSIKMVEKLARKGYEIETSYGKFFIDYTSEETNEASKKIPLRTDAILAKGYQGTVLYNQKTESFFINLNSQTPEKFDFDLIGAINLRGKMLIKPVSDKNPLQVSLREIIEKLGGDPEEAKGKLKEALEKNDLWINIFEIKPREFKTRKKGEKDHFGVYYLNDEYRKHGIIVEPPSFTQENGKIYQVRIIKDTNPKEERKGAYLFKIIGEKKEEKETYIVTVELSPKSTRWITRDLGKIGLFPEGVALDARSRYEVEIVRDTNPTDPTKGAYILKIVREVKKKGHFPLRESLKK